MNSIKRREGRITRNFLKWYAKRHKIKSYKMFMGVSAYHKSKLTHFPRG